MKYLELTEIKEALDEKGIKYKEVRNNGVIFVYVNGLMQIQKPKRTDKQKFWPEVRISYHAGDYGYYVKACGAIYDNQSIDKVMNLIDIFVTKKTH